MTTPRLSETDLARFCVHSPGAALDEALRQYKIGGGSWSYDPARATVPDALAASVPLAFDMPRVPWSLLERSLAGRCSRDAQRLANVEATKILYDESVKRRWRAVQSDFASMPIGMGEAVRYWSNVIVEDDEGPFVFFPDHRRDRGLGGAEARRIVHSMQHVWIRSRYPDLEEARLVVLRFPMVGARREMRIHVADEDALLTYEQLDERVQGVYESWGRVFEERVRERRTGTGG